MNPVFLLYLMFKRREYLKGLTIILQGPSGAGKPFLLKF
jgi:hypothetical protein